MDKHLKISIAGSPLEGKSLDLFEWQVLQKMAKSTTDSEVERYKFAMLHYRYEFTAVDLDMNKIDTLHKQIMALTRRYLAKWTYAININYQETEKDS